MKIQSLLNKIEAENEIFDKLTKAEKRVVIAQDCLERINLENIYPTRDGFISSVTYLILKQKNCSLKDAINSSEDCSACAKGSLFLSYVGRVNKMETLNLENGNDRFDSSHKKLLEIFTIRQLAMIEFAYENHQFIHYNFKGNAIIFSNEGKIKDFYAQFTHSRFRMIAICENIIKNKGTFKI